MFVPFYFSEYADISEEKEPPKKADVLDVPLTSNQSLYNSHVFDGMELLQPSFYCNIFMLNI